MLSDLVAMIDAGRTAAVRSVNAIMTATYWAIGRRIVEHEQHGAPRASYLAATRQFEPSFEPDAQGRDRTRVPWDETKQLSRADVGKPHLPIHRDANAHS